MRRIGGKEGDYYFGISPVIGAIIGAIWNVSTFSYNIAWLTLQGAVYGFFLVMFANVITWNIKKRITK